MLGDSQWWTGVKKSLELNTLLSRGERLFPGPASLGWKSDGLVWNCKDWSSTTALFSGLHPPL